MVGAVAQGHEVVKEANSAVFLLKVLDGKDRDRMLGTYKKVQKWVESTRKGTQSHFDEVH